MDNSKHLPSSDVAALTGGSDDLGSEPGGQVSYTTGLAGAALLHTRATPPGTGG